MKSYLTFFSYLGDQSTEGTKKSGRSKRNRKRGKRKPDTTVAAKSAPNAAEEDNKENQATSKDNVSEDWLADDSDDEEPKYIWRNVTKGCFAILPLLASYIGWKFENFSGIHILREIKFDRWKMA